MLGCIAAINLAQAPASTQPKEAEKGAPLPPPPGQPGLRLPGAVEKPASILDIKGPWCHCLLGSGDLERSLSLSHILLSRGITPL